MKKALILTASFGGGHNKAANNIREKLELRGFDVEEIDLLNKQNLFDKKITKAYKVLINYKLNSREDNFENKKSLIIVKVDNNWKLLNPNNYN